MGNELGSIHKTHAQVKIALCYPDLYEIGMSYLGLQILYHLFNSCDNTLCERVFAPFSDAEELLRKTNTPLASIESGMPVKNFDCLGFSLQYELTYTNVLNILELSHIPIHREERDDSYPLIIAGGTGTFNPAPISAFFDAMFVGEIEPVLPHFIELLKNRLHKSDLLKELSKLDGIFVPEFNNYAKSQYAPELRNSDCPISPILPFLAIERDSLVVEIARGCTNGCRFCQAGMTRRPYRERDAKSILELARQGARNTGYTDVSLLSLSASEHSEIINIIKGIKQLNLNPVLPSIPITSLTPELASILPNHSFTLVPEAGTERLRKILNKNMTDEQIINACSIASQYGATHIKLYYMIGLPGEREEDIEGIIKLTNEISKVFRNQINISISPFVPKPHTPFQWEAQDGLQVIENKAKYIKSSLGKLKRKLKPRYRDPRVSFIEGIIGRGDTKVSKIIESAWKEGAKFDAWTEHFHYELWEEAFNKTGINPDIYLKIRDEEESLPWDTIDTGISKEYLSREYRNTDITLNCRTGRCINCGVCETPNIIPLTKTQHPNDSVLYGRFKKTSPVPTIKTRFRIKYEKTETLRFLGHLDLVRAITRAIERINIPVAYSQGFVKRPQISFSPPLPFGTTSREEYFDILLETHSQGDIKTKLNDTLPEGLRVLEAERVPENSTPLFEKFRKSIYNVEGVSISEEKIQEFMKQKEIMKYGLNLRDFVIEIRQEENEFLMTMVIGKVKPKQVLSALLQIPEEEALDFKIERARLLP